MSASPNTPGSSRPQRTHDVLGTPVTLDDHLLPANRLPTKMQVADIISYIVCTDDLSY